MVENSALKVESEVEPPCVTISLKALARRVCDGLIPGSREVERSLDTRLKNGPKIRPDFQPVSTSVSPLDEQESFEEKAGLSALLQNEKFLQWWRSLPENPEPGTVFFTQDRALALALHCLISDFLPGFWHYVEQTGSLFGVILGPRRSQPSWSLGERLEVLHRASGQSCLVPQALPFFPETKR
jgi:hypothetical protein